MQTQGFAGFKDVDPVSGAGPSCFGETARRIRARVGGTTGCHVSFALTRLECFIAYSYNASHRLAFHLKSVRLARTFDSSSPLP
jgi:hypothetical protein